MSYFRSLFRAACVLAVAPAAAAAQGAVLERIQVHGYLTQGFGASDSLPLLGFTNRGSADFRAAAVQLRVAATDQDVAVVQVANRRMGESALNELLDGVNVQWAYYQRALGRGFSAKAGRVPMARGIYNEVRKVGTVLPFYRAPYNFYTESFETVDGALLRHDAQLGAWGLETSLFGGTIDYFQRLGTSVFAPRLAIEDGKQTMVGIDPVRDTTYLIHRRGDRGIGTQLWLSTPVQGLRVGVGGTSFSLNDLHELNAQATRTASTMVQGGIDGSFTRVQLRGEWEQLHVGEFLYTGHYVQGGVKLTERLSLNVQREAAHVHFATRPVIIGVPAERTPLVRRNSDYSRDYSAGVNFAYRPYIVLKLEGHDNKGVNYDRTVQGTPTGRYFISTVAVSF